MSKKNLYIDFDNTIVQSTKAVISLYNESFRFHDDFKYANWEKVNRWDFSDEAPLIKNVELMFQNKKLFDRLNFIDKDMKDVLKILNDKYNVTIVSIGTYGNIALKSIWIAQNIPFIKNSIFIVNEGCKMDKSIINITKDDILIDDHQNNLSTSLAGIKVCFADLGKKEWNKDWMGLRVKYSKELLEILDKQII